MIEIYQNEEHKRRVIERGDGYEYIGSYKYKEVTLDGNKSKSHIRVKCPYCSKEYDVRLDHFDNGVKCSHCCNSYENSFAYYIQQELQEPLNKYWDWEKNTVNPYCVTPQSNKKVYIKCDKTDYHNSYKTTLYHFYKGDRCPYCSTRHGKVHPKDSFGQWLINTYGEDAIKKYWSPKNKLDPFKLLKLILKEFIYIVRIKIIIMIKEVTLQLHNDFIMEIDVYIVILLKCIHWIVSEVCIQTNLNIGVKIIKNHLLKFHL